MTSLHTTSISHTPLTPPVANALDLPEQPIKHTPFGAAEHVTQTAHSLMHEVSPALNRMADEVAALSQQVLPTVQASSHQIGDKVHQVSDRTVGYIRNEPVKSVLMAVALGATLVKAFQLINRPHHQR